MTQNSVEWLTLRVYLIKCMDLCCMDSRKSNDNFSSFQSKLANWIALPFPGEAHF